MTNDIEAAQPAQSQIGLEEALLETPNWHLITRLTFRFFLAYFVFSNQQFWDLSKLVGWVDNAVFKTGLAASRSQTGSGDTTFDYIQLFCIIVAALIAMLAWTIFDVRRANYIRLHAWFCIAVRYTLASALLSYGMGKVFNTQFPFPTLSYLSSSYNESSPMGLLWRFMGYSQEYTAFAGGLEVLAGVLLLIRRTSTLGALLGFAVMTNVVMLNFCYDVPVKIYSSQLLLLAVFLLLPDVPRLINVLVLNRSVQARVHPSLLVSVWAKRLGFGAKILVLTLLAYTSIYNPIIFWQDISTKTLNRTEIIKQVNNPERYLLVTRGFHWINEFPNNR